MIAIPVKHYTMRQSRRDRWEIDAITSEGHIVLEFGPSQLRLLASQGVHYLDRYLQEREVAEVVQLPCDVEG
jgi:hypothetical protein